MIILIFIGLAIIFLLLSMLKKNEKKAIPKPAETDGKQVDLLNSEAACKPEEETKEMDPVKKLISETILKLDLYSAEAVELMCGTCAQESGYGKFRHQLNGGPALGIFQCEPRTFDDIIKNFLFYDKELMAKITEISGEKQLEASRLEVNDVLAACICRIHYLRIEEAIPKSLEGWARYYKQYYNTPKGKATEQEFIENYRRYVLKGTGNAGTLS